MLGCTPGRGRIRQQVLRRLIRADRFKSVRGRGVAVEARREPRDIARRDEPVESLPRTGRGIGAATQCSCVGRQGSEITQAAMQQGPERCEWKRFGRMAAL